MSDVKCFCKLPKSFAEIARVVSNGARNFIMNSILGMNVVNFSRYNIVRVFADDSMTR